MKGYIGKSPAFQFYVKDWLSDSELQKAHPTTRGIWINLLCYMWDALNKGTLETNERELCQLGSCLPEDVATFLLDAKRLAFCEISIACPTLSQNCPANITIKNRRMIRERLKREEWRLRKQRQREEKFKQIKEKDEYSSMSHQCPTLSPTPTPIPTAKKDLKYSCANAKVFLIFWNAYPRKKNKAFAKKAFLKLNPDKKLCEIILAKIEEAKKTQDWQKDNGQYIPYPSTWLNARGWEDEFPAEKNWKEEIRSKFKEKEKELNNEI